MSTWQERNPKPDSYAVLGAAAHQEMAAERRVEDAREGVLDSALKVEEAVTTGTDVQQEVAELVTMVREYRAAMEAH